MSCASKQRGWRHLKLQGDVTICYDVDVCCWCLYFLVKCKACKNVPLLRPSSHLPWVLGWLLEPLEVDGASSFAPSSSKPDAIDPPHPGDRIVDPVRPVPLNCSFPNLIFSTDLSAKSIFVVNQSSMAWEEWKRQRYKT